MTQKRIPEAKIQLFSECSIGHLIILLTAENASLKWQKRRWWSRLTANLCFRPHGHPRRIADAGPTSPEPSAATDHTAAYIHHAPQPVLAFFAPPSSPASSLLASEAPSPVLLLNASTYSSPSAGPRSIFAIGPYAREPQQLVSPPVPSAFTTEPSTAPLTPPPGYLHLVTNPSSPEVPFARFLASSSHAAEQHCGGGEGFHAYQLYPGSPIVGPLVSPGSVCSTTSSPPPPLFRVTEQPPRILGPEEVASGKLHRLRARNEGSLLDGHIPVAEPAPSGGQSSRAASFEASTGSEEGGGSARLCVDETYDELPKSGEFVFGNADGGAAAVVAASVPSDWFADEGSGRASMDGEARKKWPFFPMVEHGSHGSIWHGSDN